MWQIRAILKFLVTKIQSLAIIERNPAQEEVKAGMPNEQIYSVVNIGPCDTVRGPTCGVLSKQEDRWLCMKVTLIEVGWEKVSKLVGLF